MKNFVKDREDKIKFIEILLILGGLLGTALTLSKQVTIWGLSSLSISLFIFFSLGYYYVIAYSPLKKTKDIKLLKRSAFMTALFFSVLFANVIAGPVIENSLSVFKENLQFAAITTLVIVLGYFGILTYFIYRIMVLGFVKEDRLVSLIKRIKSTRTRKTKK